MDDTSGNTWSSTAKRRTRDDNKTAAAGLAEYLMHKFNKTKDKDRNNSSTPTQQKRVTYYEDVGTVAEQASLEDLPVFVVDQDASLSEDAADTYYFLSGDRSGSISPPKQRQQKLQQSAYTSPGNSGKKKQLVSSLSPSPKYSSSNSYLQASQQQSPGILKQQKPIRMDDASDTINKINNQRQQQQQQQQQPQSSRGVSRIPMPGQSRSRSRSPSSSPGLVYAVSSSSPFPMSFANDDTSSPVSPADSVTVVEQPIFSRATTTPVIGGSHPSISSAPRISCGATPFSTPPSLPYPILAQEPNDVPYNIPYLAKNNIATNHLQNALHASRSTSLMNTSLGSSADPLVKSTTSISSTSTPDDGDSVDDRSTMTPMERRLSLLGQSSLCMPKGAGACMPFPTQQHQLSRLMVTLPTVNPKFPPTINHSPSQPSRRTLINSIKESMYNHPRQEDHDARSKGSQSTLINSIKESISKHAQQEGNNNRRKIAADPPAAISCSKVTADPSEERVRDKTTTPKKSRRSPEVLHKPNKRPVDSPRNRKSTQDAPPKKVRERSDHVPKSIKMEPRLADKSSNRKITQDAPPQELQVRSSHVPENIRMESEQTKKARSDRHRHHTRRHRTRMKDAIGQVDSAIDSIREDSYYSEPVTTNTSDTLDGTRIPILRIPLNSESQSQSWQSPDERHRESFDSDSRRTTSNSKHHQRPQYHNESMESESRQMTAQTSDPNLIYRVASPGEDTASRKEELLQSMGTTEKTNTTTAVVCSQMRETTSQLALPGLDSCGSRSTISSLSANEEDFKRRQRSHPGTRKEKRNYYKARGNEAYKTYEPITLQGSRSLASFSTWDTNDKGLLVPPSPQRDRRDRRALSSIREQPNLASCVLHSSSSESSSESTAVEDIIARCQHKLEYRPPPRYR